ncbi:MAG: dTMP kinase [Planctomycetes bacterium]|nr:dTMP kinase [Planctomycetota bacterium]
MEGMIFAIEGVEGAGKSTLAGKVIDYVESMGFPAVLLRDPGDTPLGERIRDILLSGREACSPMAETFLFMAARRQLVDERIVPALEEGKVVVLDRFLLSTMAYQGMAGGVGVDIVLELGRMAVGNADPRLTLLLDLPAEEGFRRIAGSRPHIDAIEGRGLEYHRAVREGFLLACRKYPWKVSVLDATRPEEEVVREAIEMVSDVLTDN